MKRLLSCLLLLPALVLAEDDDTAARAKTLLAELEKANDEDNIGRVKVLLARVKELGKTAKETKPLEPIASELRKSLKMARGNHGTMMMIIEALGELRTKKGASTLRRIAFNDDPDTEQEAEEIAAALQAISLAANRRYLGGIADQMKNRNLIVAKAAFKACGGYATADGRVRRQVAEVLMKGMEREYPSGGGQGNKQISEEQQKRWQAISPIVVEAMQAVCRQPTIVNIENWREWWKENKRSSPAWKDDEKS